MTDHFEGKNFVICIDNRGNEASLEQWKIYPCLPDREAEKHKEIRVIDEEGEDYLYPAACFSPVLLEHSAAKMFMMQNIISKRHN